MALRDFLKGTFKLALALFLVVIALALTGWGIMAYQERKEKLAAQPYEMVKTWRKDLKQYLHFDLTARTKLVGGRLRADVDVHGFPAYLSHPRLQQKNRDAQIVLIFEDSDGFKVYEKALKVSEFSATVDPKGNKVALNHQFEEYVGLSTYRSFSTMTVRWTLDTNVPSEPKIATAPAPKQKVVSNKDDGDHCAPGLAKPERLRRLAKFGVVRQTGDNTYTVGQIYSMNNKEITFYSESIGGGMLSCR